MAELSSGLFPAIAVATVSGVMFKRKLIAVGSLALLAMPALATSDRAEEKSAEKAEKSADQYQETINIFRNAGQSGDFFRTAYGFAVFPSIGKGAVGIGGAGGKGRVYRQGQYVGDVSMSQVTLGFQLGGKAYRQIIFFQDERAFREFTSGNFEFGATAQATAVTSSAGAHAGTGGSGSGASASQREAKTRGQYQKGMAVFTVAKGGLMYEASIGGQKFKYTPRSSRGASPE